MTLNLGGSFSEPPFSSQTPRGAPLSEPRRRRAVSSDENKENLAMAFWSLSNRQQTVAPAEPAAAMDAATLKSELDHAYDRGRSAERVRHGGRGLMTLVLVLFAGVGVLFLALGARDGTFAGAGADVDRTVAQAMSQVGL
jgi:hypothetical protein